MKKNPPENWRTPKVRIIVDSVCPKLKIASFCLVPKLLIATEGTEPRVTVDIANGIINFPFNIVATYYGSFLFISALIT